MHYYCQCLNVTIDVNHQEKSTNIEPISFANLSEQWLEYNLLSDLSIHIAWESLIKSIPVGDMKLNRCLVCYQNTHIINNESKQILINKDLLNETTVKDCYSNPNYSKVIKIVLPKGIIKPSAMSVFGSQSRLTTTCQRECELVQQLYRQSLEDADRETEEKIRIYQEEQAQLLLTKKAATHKELDTFLNLMRSMPRYTTNIKTSSILQSSNSYINENSMESGFGSDIFDTNGADISRQSSIFERAFSERSSNIDEDPLLDNTDWYTGKDSLSNSATSLPKDIAFHPYSNPESSNDENNDLERIGKSFRELSQSLMCTDGTELFGDLPSPRLDASQT